MPAPEVTWQYALTLGVFVAAGFWALFMVRELWRLWKVRRGR